MESSSSRLMRLVCLIVVQALSVQFQIILCNGCLEKERIALLQIKASMSHYPPYGHYFFESWDSDGGGSGDCCGWEGVKCNITTGKVIKLVLSRASDGWPLDASVFTPFKDLAHLDLSLNFIWSGVPHQGLGRLSALQKLKTLILSSNNFDNSVLPSLGELSSLRTLSLFGNKLHGTFDFREIHNMTNLYELDLENNYINAIEGLGQLRTLDRLEILKLGENQLNNSILPSLGFLSTLKALSLHDNQFTGSFDLRELPFMINLEELDLSVSNYGVNYGITDLKGLERSSKLSILYLGGNKLNESHNSIIQSIGALPSLTKLDMSYNNLRGHTFANGSFVFSNLQELDLSGNQLEGMIPYWLGNLTSLRYLDLSDNQFEGNLALSPVADLNKLECLIISENNLEIPISLTSFFNHSKLEALEADNNRRLLNESVEEFHVPKFQLQFLSFTNCWSNNPITKLPDFFHYQSELRRFDLSQINLAVPFPTWLLENNTLLEQCVMRNNSLTGSLLLPSNRILPLTTMIDISDNLLSGQVPENIDRIFPSLSGLDMSRNQFGGGIPTSLGRLKYLEMLDLSSNNLSGEIPSWDCPSFYILKLSHNRLSGHLSSSLFNLTALESLHLDDNHFVGEIPESFFGFSLVELDLSNNHFSGKLPRRIGNMSGLDFLAMASNHLEGSIPMEFCNPYLYFEFLDLSDNELSGSIPSCFNPPRIRHVHLNRNKLSGPMTPAFHNCTLLVTLDLLDNNFTGAIPSWIGYLPSLGALILKNNNFQGKIPLQLCNLESLSLLDLSQNNLSGRLPLCLGSMQFRTMYRISGCPTTMRWGFRHLRTNIYDKYPMRFKGRGIPLYSSTVTNQVEFSTKYGSYSYRGSVLDLMSGIDLSCNHFTGEIPTVVGNLSNILALNLSHNHLTGSIPTTFSKLTAIESLDLSYNSLSGRIPLELVELEFLESFSVAHNNLSGPVPDRKAQFATFDEKSYEGNPLLCGLPLSDSCSNRTETEPAKPQKAPEQEVKGDDDDDMTDFYASSIATYVTVLIIIAAIFVINPRWRRAWFYYVEWWMTSSYYFVLDTFNRRVIV